MHLQVENFQNWARREKQKVFAPNTLDKPGSGISISDIGMKGMLDELMKQFISPISKGILKGERVTQRLDFPSDVYAPNKFIF